MEQYLVIAQLTPNTKGKYENHRILKFDGQKSVADQTPKEFERLLGPASLDECVNFLKGISGGSTNWFGLTVAQYVLIGVVTLAFVWVVVNGATKLQAFSPDSTLNLITNADDSARILITFLVAVATVAIAFLAILTAMVIREYKERFALAKEVLTLLIGILGTIVGFYFGTAGYSKPNSNANANSNITIGRNTNANANAKPDLSPTPTIPSPTNGNR